MKGNGPTNPRLAHRTESLRRVYKALPRAGANDSTHGWFRLTRLSEDGRDAYGYYCTGVAGVPIPRTPLVKLPLNARGTAPQGFAVPRTRDYVKAAGE